MRHQYCLSWRWFPETQGNNVHRGRVISGRFLFGVFTANNLQKFQCIMPGKLKGWRFLIFVWLWKIQRISRWLCNMGWGMTTLASIEPLQALLWAAFMLVLKEVKKGIVALWTSLFYRLGNTATPVNKTVSVWCRKQANWEAALGRSSSAAHCIVLLSSCCYTARSAMGSEPFVSPKAPQQTQRWGAGPSLDAMDILSPLTSRQGEIWPMGFL